MSPPRRAPQQLKIVAYLFMIEGLLWMALTVMLSLIGTIFINPLVVMVLLGLGLLHLSRAAYHWVYMLSWLYVPISIFTLLVSLVFVRGFFAAEVKNWLDLVPSAAGAGVFALKTYQIGILDSPPVRRAFGLPDRY